MGFAEDQIPQLHVLWNHKALSEPHNTKLIFREALGCSVLDFLLNAAHSNVRLLSRLDPIHQGWLHNQGSEGTMLNQTQVGTLKFLQKGGLMLLEQQGIAMRFTTKCIGNDISLARMIVIPMS